jgi:hypothetical protein
MKKLSSTCCYFRHPDKKAASDGNRQPLLTSETTKRIRYGVLVLMSCLMFL